MRIIIKPTGKIAAHGDLDASIFTGLTEAGIEIVCGVVVLSSVGMRIKPRNKGGTQASCQRLQPPFTLEPLPHELDLWGQRCQLWRGTDRTSRTRLVFGLLFINTVELEHSKRLKAEFLRHRYSGADLASVTSATALPAFAQGRSPNWLDERFASAGKDGA